MDFLVTSFTFLGIPFQPWMPIFAVGFVLYALYLWKTQRK